MLYTYDSLYVHTYIIIKRVGAITIMVVVVVGGCLKTAYIHTLMRG
jgi:hypothetical protein